MIQARQDFRDLFRRVFRTRNTLRKSKNVEVIETMGIVMNRGAAQNSDPTPSTT